jgi:hypothetical protein
LSFKEVFEYLAPKSDPAPHVQAKLFGIDVLEPFFSSIRH